MMLNFAISIYGVEEHARLEVSGMEEALQVAAERKPSWGCVVITSPAWEGRVSLFVDEDTSRYQGVELHGFSGPAPQSATKVQSRLSELLRASRAADLGEVVDLAAFRARRVQHTPW